MSTPIGSRLSSLFPLLRRTATRVPTSRTPKSSIRPFSTPAASQTSSSSKSRREFKIFDLILGPVPKLEAPNMRNMTELDQNTAFTRYVNEYKQVNRIPRLFRDPVIKKKNSKLDLQK
jgi:hypothetical protein